MAETKSANLIVPSRRMYLENIKMSFKMFCPTSRRRNSLQNQNRQNVGAKLEADVAQCIPEPLRSQNARLLLRVHLEYALPRLEVDHEELKVVESDSRSILLVHQADDLATHVKVGTAANVVVWKTSFEKLLKVEAGDRSEKKIFGCRKLRNTANEWLTCDRLPVAEIPVRIVRFRLSHLKYHRWLG